MQLLAGPLLVAAAVAGPDLHRGAIGSASAGHIEAEAGLATDDGAVGVEVPLLVRAVIAVVDLHPGARRLGVSRHVEALAAVHLQFTVGQGGPLLVRTAGTVIDLQQRAVGRSRPWHVQAPVRAHSPQRPGRTPTTAPGAAPAVLKPIETGLVGDAQREVGATAIQRGDRARCVLAGARALGLGSLLDAGPQDRAHAQATRGIGDPVQVRQVVVAVPGAVVVDAGVHRDAELGQHCAAGIAAQVVLEVGDPGRLGGVRVAEHAVDVDRQQGPVQAQVGTLGAQVLVRVRTRDNHAAPGQAGVACQPGGLEVGQIRGAVGPGLVHDIEVEMTIAAVLVDHHIPHLVERRGVTDRPVLQPGCHDHVHTQRAGRIEGSGVAVPPRSGRGRRVERHPHRVGSQALEPLQDRSRLRVRGRVTVRCRQTDRDQVAGDEVVVGIRPVHSVELVRRGVRGQRDSRLHPEVAQHQGKDQTERGEPPQPGSAHAHCVHAFILQFFLLWASIASISLLLVYARIADNFKLFW